MSRTTYGRDGKPANTSMKRTPTPQKTHVNLKLRLLKPTAVVLERLQAVFGVDNRADTIARCVHLSRLIIQAHAAGKTVQLVDPDGKVETLKFREEAAEGGE